MMGITWFMSAVAWNAETPRKYKAVNVQQAFLMAQESRISDIRPLPCCLHSLPIAWFHWKFGNPNHMGLGMIISCDITRESHTL